MLEQKALPDTPVTSDQNRSLLGVPARQSSQPALSIQSSAVSKESRRNRPEEAFEEDSANTMATTAHRSGSRTSLNQKSDPSQPRKLIGQVRKAQSPAGSREKTTKKKKKSGLLSFLNCCSPQDADSDEGEGPAVPPKEANGVRTASNSQNAIPLNTLPSGVDGALRDPLDQRATALRDSDKTMVNTDVQLPAETPVMGTNEFEKGEEAGTTILPPENERSPESHERRTVDPVPRLDTSSRNTGLSGAANPMVVVQPPSAVSAASETTDIELSPITPQGANPKTPIDHDATMVQAPHGGNGQSPIAGALPVMPVSADPGPAEEASPLPAPTSEQGRTVPQQPQVHQRTNEPETRSNIPPPPTTPPPAAYVATRSASHASSIQTIRLLPPIAPQHQGRKCLVLDLDETLVHSSFKVCYSFVGVVS